MRNTIEKPTPEEIVEVATHQFERAITQEILKAIPGLNLSMHLQDLHQEVYMNLFLKGDQYEPGRGALHTFIRRVAYSTAVDWYRANVVRQPDTVSTDTFVGDDGQSVPIDDVVGQAAGPETDPECIYAAEQLGDYLDELARADLSPTELIVYRGMREGWTTSEIAEAADITLNHVYNCKHRVREKLARYV